MKAAHGVAVGKKRSIGEFRKNCGMVLKREQRKTFNVILLKSVIKKKALS